LVETGFYEPPWYIAIDAKRNLCWAQGDGRIKAFDLTTHKCKYTLYSGTSTAILILEIDGEDWILSSRRSNNEIWMWKISQLQEHRRNFSVKDLPEEQEEEIEDEEEGLEEKKSRENSKEEVDLDKPELLDLLDESIRDDFDNVEVTKGQEKHHSVTVQYGDDYELPIHYMIAIQPGHIAIAHQYSIYLMNIQSGMVYRQLIGHTADIESLYQCKSLPTLLVSSSRDRTAKIWNLQTGLCEVTLTGHLRGIYSAILEPVNGVPFCFTAGADECIKVWDLRQGICIYELSTGNNHVHSLGFHSSNWTLYAVTEEMNLDRFGSDDEKEEKEKEISWPSNSVHTKKDFQQVWDFQESGLIAYTFLPNSDASKFNPSYEASMSQSVLEK